MPLVCPGRRLIDQMPAKNHLEPADHLPGLCIVRERVKNATTPRRAALCKQIAGELPSSTRLGA
jgi:hypothetical protein